MKTVVDLVTTIKTYFIGKDTAAKQAVENTIATVEIDATSASKSYSVGEQLYLEDILYDVTASITAGDPLTVGTNIAVAPKLAASVNGKQDQIEVTTMPTASAAYAGKVLIYIGATTLTYTSGQSYQCVEESGSYSWVPVGGSGSVTAANVSYDNTSSGMTADDVQEAVDELNTALANKQPKTLDTPITIAGTQQTTVEGALGGLNDALGALYFTSVACSATTGDFLSKNDAAITADYVLAECVFANPSAITTDVTWTTSSGNITLNGTCSTATTANLVLVKKSN